MIYIGTKLHESSNKDINYSISQEIYKRYVLNKIKMKDIILANNFHDMLSNFKKLIPRTIFASITMRQVGGGSDPS